MRLLARAKINWTLDITGQREDGYHFMDMLMQPVTLSDVVDLEIADDVTLTCSGTPYLPPDEHHLALRAARALKEHTNCDKGARIHVHKCIPVGAGMGGGSADAAAVLTGLNQLWQLHLSQAALEAIGLTLGADVPFCLRGGLQRVQGIGEKMSPVPCKKMLPLCVLQPCEGLSTGAVFKAYHGETVHARPQTQQAMEALEQGDLPKLAVSLGNVLQSVSEGMRPAIGQAIQSLLDAGAVTAWMTGSGSAVFGVFEDDASAAQAGEHLRQQCERCWICSTCMDSIADGSAISTSWQTVSNAADA